MSGLYVYLLLLLMYLFAPVGNVIVLCGDNVTRRLAALGGR